MDLKELLQTINDEAKIIVSSDFKIEINGTSTVPNIESQLLTFENLDTKNKKVAFIETCVLFIDIRKSTELNFKHQPQPLSKLYALFVRSMIKAAKHYNGHVRNIIGDRIMVIFDTVNCFSNAINTAILMNTIATKIINKHFINNDIKCGIGVDYGKMWVSKVGTIKKGEEKELYRSLVWLGKPANIASKLTDYANKVVFIRHDIMGVKDFENGPPYKLIIKPINEIFNDKDEEQKDYDLPDIDENISILAKKDITFETKNILISEEVYKQYKKENTDNTWEEQLITIKEYNGKIYGASLIYKLIEEVK
jgi:adenylate cyclase